MTARPPVLRREDQDYAACYCEENVYRLAGHPALAGYARHVAFVSNHGRSCAMWAQQLAAQDGLPVVWDYHVILFVQAGLRRWVYDLDSTVDFPVEARAYLEASFPFADRLPEVYAPRFRVVEAGRLFAVFSSDRSHMRDDDGTFRAPPPVWPAIRPAGAPPTNLDRFVDTEAEFEGRCFDLAGLYGWIG